MWESISEIKLLELVVTTNSLENFKQRASCDRALKTHKNDRHFDHPFSQNFLLTLIRLDMKILLSMERYNKSSDLEKIRT